MIFGGVVVLLLTAFPEIETPLWWQLVVTSLVFIETSFEMAALRGFINDLRGKNKK